MTQFFTCIKTSSIDLPSRKLYCEIHPQSLDHNTFQDLVKDRENAAIFQNAWKSRKQQSYKHRIWHWLARQIFLHISPPRWLILLELETLQRRNFFRRFSAIAGGHRNIESGRQFSPARLPVLSWCRQYRNFISLCISGRVCLKGHRYAHRRNGYSILPWTASRTVGEPKLVNINLEPLPQAGVMPTTTSTACDFRSLFITNLSTTPIYVDFLH